MGQGDMDAQVRAMEDAVQMAQRQLQLQEQIATLQLAQLEALKDLAEVMNDSADTLAELVTLVKVAVAMDRPIPATSDDRIPKRIKQLSKVIELIETIEAEEAEAEEQPGEPE